MSFDGAEFGREIVALVKDFVSAELQPLLARIADLEARPDPVGIADAIKGADGVLRLSLSDGRLIETGIRDGAPAPAGPDVSEIVRDAVDAALAKALPPQAHPLDTDEIEGLRLQVSDLAIRLDSFDIGGAVAAAVASFPVPENGRDGTSVTLEDVLPHVARAVSEAVAALPPPRDGEQGRDADPEMIRQMVREAVADIPAPKDGRDGKLPLVKAWEDRVHYEGEVCTHGGATWQAACDTGRAPPHADWTCLAARGGDGRDADQILPCGAYDPQVDYRRLSIVMMNGASFIAKCDGPGPCPGEGWYLLARQGKTGKPGPVTKGDRGASVARMSVNDDAVLCLRMDDGSEISCDLYPLLSRLA